MDELRPFHPSKIRNIVHYDEELMLEDEELMLNPADSVKHKE